MDRKGHLRIDKIVHGKYFNEVHQWMDETYPNYPENPYKHWLNRHYQEAIYFKYGFGTPEFNAAYTHILMDFISHFQIAFVPKTQKELIEMLQSLEVLPKNEQS